MLRPTRRFVTLLLVPLVAVATLGCGGGSDDDGVALGQAPVEGGGASVPVPTLPSVATRQPGAFDEQGCPRVGPDEVDCSSTAADLDRVASEPVEGWRTLAGFVGPHFVSEVTAGTVALLDATMVTSSTGPWSTTGLVRNETTGPVTDLVVEAVLLDAGGVELDRVVSAVAVDPLRAGEPAPFAVESTTPAESVADVQWSIVSQPAPTAVDARVLELVTWWDRGVDDPEPVDLYLYRDDPAQPLPYLLFGALTNHGSDAIGSPVVVAAWLDEQGRVIAVAETDAITDPASASGGAPLAAGASADFLFVLGADRPAGVDVAQVMLWGVAR